MPITAESQHRGWRPTLANIQEQREDEHHDVGTPDDGTVRNSFIHGAVVSAGVAGEFHERNTIPYSVRDTVTYQGVEINTIPYSERDSITYQGVEINTIPYSERDSITYQGGEHERSDERNPINCRTGDGRTSRRRRRRDDDFLIYFANITSWHEGAQAYVVQADGAMASSHILCVVETHLQGPKLIKMV